MHFPLQTDRRTMLKMGALAIGAPALIGLRDESASQTAIVETRYGKLRGEQARGAVSFRGIAYAADTSGPNRFMPPRPVAPWAGVRDALAYGDRCIQAGRFGQPPRQRGEARPQSENCCVLNVYTPDLNPGAKRPVMFWMHGGGFRSGAGDAPELDGVNLAKAGDVVVVTINHRLNLFGYLTLGHLDPDFADAGNVGQLDLVAALQWVRDNIAAFGGDPGNVTIFGQSGGGSKVATLMIMPSARGLFHRAINLSGPTFYTMDPAANWEPLSNAFVRELGVGKGDIRRLQQLPPQQLLAAHGAAVRALKTDDFRPVIDGRIIPHGPLTQAGLTLNGDVPLMMGTTDTEATLWLRNEPANATVTDAQVRSRFMQQFGMDDAQAAALIAGYRQDPQNHTPWDILASLSSDTMFRGRMLLAAEALANARTLPVYLYNFCWRIPTDGGVWGAPHAVDIPFAFGNVEALVDRLGGGVPPIDASKNVMAAFLAFARTGNPNNDRMPKWDPYDGKRRATMTVNTQCAQVDDYRGHGRVASLGLLKQDAY